MTTAPPRHMMGFDPGFSTPEMTAIFSLDARFRHMLAVESALAGVMARLGIVPPETADAIRAACAATPIDADRLASAGWEVGTPVVPLLDAVRSRLHGEAGRWLHHGATTQDIVDTSTVLQMRQGLDELASINRRATHHLAALVGTNRRTPIIGRTFLQPGAATTFGVVLAAWMTALDRHGRDLQAWSQRLPVQLGGPVGDLAALGEAGPKAVELLAAELGLSEPVLPWHTDRYPITGAIAAIESMARTTAKIAADVALLSQLGEVGVRPGRSSTMPHKANPIDAIRAAAASDACLGAASVVTRGRPHELQRGVGGWHAEWWAVPMTFHCAGAAAESIERCLDSLESRPERMAANMADAGLPPTDAAAADMLIDRALAAVDQGAS